VTKIKKNVKNVFYVYASFRFIAMNKLTTAVVRVYSDRVILLDVQLTRLG